MIPFEEIKEHILKNINALGSEFTRIFHGRGHCFEGYEMLTIDSIDTILHVAYFAPLSSELEKAFCQLFEQIFATGRYRAIVLQLRYEKKSPTLTLFGEVPTEVIAYEEGMKFHINVLENQNNGFFGDMRKGRAFIREHAKDRRILNLFSYTCAFGVAASMGGAKEVVNVDMSKKALSVGKQNYHLNGLETRGVRFLPYNILKSFSRIKKHGPYDVIIIDPPSFQKGSFASTKDYAKIIRRLDALASERCTVLAALNNPQLDTQFLLDIFRENAPSFHFVKRLENCKSYPTKEAERALKNLVFSNTTA